MSPFCKHLKQVTHMQTHAHTHLFFFSPCCRWCRKAGGGGRGFRQANKRPQEWVYEVLLLVLPQKKNSPHELSGSSIKDHSLGPGNKDQVLQLREVGGGWSTSLCCCCFCCHCRICGRRDQGKIKVKIKGTAEAAELVLA